MIVLISENYYDNVHVFAFSNKKKPKTKKKKKPKKKTKQKKNKKNQSVKAIFNFLCYIYDIVEKI